jgi:DNA gyrase inhibitor GyrI
MREDAVIRGFARDDPRGDPAASCRYDACIVVTEDYEIRSEPVNEAKLFPAADTRSSRSGTRRLDLQKAWNGNIPELAEHGYNMDVSRPILERYIPEMVNKHLSEICVPLPAE